ncbi:flagellar hook protein [Rubripirellula amarantea]|uniref:Flagellar hook-associated protein FlgL n=1 Tax=Rubripirellula amarantea TaxID=2527999 RepID=A0A5C5WDM8_9BACT|nr:flagellar hook protein [Rubripirellula amarantea]MDA8743441.1 flagellar hook protein [Rubripirellula amarantea]TWT48135.1 flagellar hook-associated protein FlgL [Rubripirellula amarantea]
MSLLPISTNRTSTPLSTQRLLYQLNNDQLALQRQYDQLSTGRRVLSLSDDPAAATRAIGLQRSIDNSTQIIRNAQSTSNFYQATDSTLGRVDNALIEARGVAVSAASNVISEQERYALGETLQETINSVMAAGNTLFRDHQMLGGFLAEGNAFEYDNGDIVFTGNTAVAQTKLGSGVPQPVNVNANDALGANAIVLEGDSLNAALDAETRLVDLRYGEGVSRGIIKISGGSNFVDVDLRDAATIGDVVDLISGVELEGRPIVASLTNDGIRIEYSDGLAGTLAIADSVGSTTAEELSISNPSGLNPPPIIGDRLSPRVTEATKIVDLNNGAGLTLDSGIEILQGERKFTVSFDGAETLSDVLIAINRSGADVHAELNEADGKIVLRSLRSGVDYSFGENGGNDAQELGIRSATELTRLSQLNRGQGITTNFSGPELTITRPDGVVLDIELEGAESIEDVINIIESHPNNQDSRQVLVSLNDYGNGIQLKAPPGAGSLTIQQNGVSDAGEQLGLIPPGSSVNTGSIVGPVDTIIGVDYAPRDAGGALDTLLRMQKAVVNGDLPEIERLQAKLDIDLDTASRTRGRVGVWSRNVDDLQIAAEDNKIKLQAQLSEELDADLATVISELSQRQATLDASMRMIGQTSQITVLNYL